jgi:hypothetical protein
MHRIRRKSLLALVVIGALVAGGAAYTNSITGSGTTAGNNAAGYADVSVTGATLADAVYTFNGSGDTITGVTFTFTGDESGKQLQFGLGTSANPAIADCVSTGMTNGVIPAADYDGSANTVVDCTGLSVTTGTATDLGVLVSNV